MIAFYERDTGRVVKIGGEHDEKPKGCATLDVAGRHEGLISSGAPLRVSGSNLVEDMDGLEARLHAALDEAAARARAAYMPDATMLTIYQRKEAEARSLLSGESGPHPFIEAEATVANLETAELALKIIQRADETALPLARIEALRRSAKIAVTNANSAKAKRAAAQVDWQSLAV